MRTLQDLKIIRLSDRNRLLAIVAGAALTTGIGGVLIGRAMNDFPSASAEANEQSQEEEGEEPGPEGFVPINAERLSASGIATEQAQPGSLTGEVIAQATVTAPPEGEALLTARASGAVVRINKRLGDPVGAGETVALLESGEAAAFVAESNAAAARAQAARSAAAREQRLYDAKITARQDLEAAIATRRTAEAELQRAQAAVRAAGVVGGGRYLAVRSPISGRITDVDTQLGAFVSAGAQLFQVADPRRIQVEASVPVSDAQRIRPGDSAQVELPSGGLVEARVRSSTPSLAQESRTATIVLELSGAPGGLTQGQAVRARIIPRGSQQSGIILPEEAVQQVEGRDIVFVQAKGGFQAKPVAVGARSGGRVHILDGLEVGQTVVTRNAFALKSQLGAAEVDED